MANQMEVIIEIILHATEDSKKVFDPLFDLFQIKEEEFSQEKIIGHYGNPILFFQAKIVKKRAEEFVHVLISKISQKQIDDVVDNIDMYFEGSSLFLRIGKDEIVNKLISLQQNDAIKIRIKLPIYKKMTLQEHIVNY